MSQYFLACNVRMWNYGTQNQFFSHKIRPQKKELENKTKKFKYPQIKPLKIKNWIWRNAYEEKRVKIKNRWRRQKNTNEEATLSFIGFHLFCVYVFSVRHHRMFFIFLPHFCFSSSLFACFQIIHLCLWISSFVVFQFLHLSFLAPSFVIYIF